MDLPSKTKFCGKCKSILDIEYFGNDKRSSDGHSSWCLRCKREHNRKYRETHPMTDAQKTRMLEQSHKWYLKNKAKILNRKRITKRRWRSKRRELGLKVT